MELLRGWGYPGQREFPSYQERGREDENQRAREHRGRTEIQWMGA